MKVFKQNLLKVIVIALLVLSQITLLAAPRTSDWKFTQDDFNALSQEQLDVLKSSYWMGKPHDLGLTLAAISIVETRAGAFKDTSKNRICGAHQVDVTIVKENLGSKSPLRKICKAIQDNHTLSAMVSLQILLYWKDNSRTLRTTIVRYNRGWHYHPHEEEFYRRFVMVLKVLEKNDLSKL